MQSIYLAEDDENVRELILNTLASRFNTAGFLNPSDFWEFMNDKTPDLVLLDAMFSRGEGLSILKRLKSGLNTKPLPVIMLTAGIDGYESVNGLDLGADDCISKPFSIPELMSRIKAVLRRSTPPEDIGKVIEMDNISLFPAKHAVKVNGRGIALTYKEFELLQLFMENQGVVFSRDKLMTRIWHSDLEGKTRTVDMHVKTLRQKLGLDGDIIRTVRGVGYKAGD